MFYKKDIDEVLSELDTSIDGLSMDEVNKRLEVNGYNIIDDDNKVSKISLFLKQFQDAMIIMLLIVSIISFVYSYIMHESFTDSIVIIFIVFLNAFMGFFQELRADASINSLKKVNNCKVRVKRDGMCYLCDSTNLVPGDIVYLEAGDKVCFDGRVISEYSSLVDESILTGESVCVSKNSEVILDDVIINDRYNMVYSGCSVMKGNITCVVCSTGMNTELGCIASSITERKDVPTPLQQKISEISRNLSVIVIFIIGFVFIYNLLFLKNDIIDIVMLCISLMVSAVPEGLPAVISISLSIGVKEMSKRNALVKTLSSVETLGALNIICSDKTGTITQNKMTVKKIFCDNKIIMPDEIDNKFLINGMYLCNDCEKEQEKYIGDPTEVALIECASLYSNPNLDSRNACIPFDSIRKMMSTVNLVEDEFILYSKGSLESILERANYINVSGKVMPLNKKMKDELLNQADDMSSNALRVIGYAYRVVDDSSLLTDDELFELENDLVFVGMVGMIDPAREGVIESIKLCHEASIIPIMITGDSLGTALAISKEVGIASCDSEGIEGRELANYTDSELVSLVRKYRVYARVTPEDKVRIVKAWQKNNEIVGMTGDGVNDAPAIRLAHVGIGMGKGGTEVTKSACDVLLLDDCFNTIVSAVREGRRIYNNIRSVILYSLSSNFAEIFIVIAGMMMGVNILLPIQILFIDLVTDTILAVCMAFEGEGNNIMKEPPHKSSNKFFTPFMTFNTVISAVIESVLILLVFLYGYFNYNFLTAQSMAFLCLIVQEMVFAFNCRNLKKPLLKHGIFSNKIMNIGIILLTFIQVLIFVTPFRNLLHIVVLDLNCVLFIILLNILAFILFEIIKPILARNLSD